MKKLKEKAVSALKAMILPAVFIIFMTNAPSAAEYVRSAVQRCLITVIPSLYAMMIISSIVIKSRILSCLPSAFFHHRIAGMKGSELSIFLYSMFAGYPVGTSMLLSEYSSEKYDRKRISILSGLCFGAGPAFISGCVSGKYPSSSAIIITISTIAANIITAFLLSPVLKRSSQQHNAKKHFQLNGETITQSILSSGKAMAEICFSITAFSAISFLLDFTGLTYIIGTAISHLTGISASAGRQLVCAFIDVTNTGCLPDNDLSLLPYISGLVSFGGICVIFQIASLAKGRISVILLIIIRTVSAVFSGLICNTIMPFFLRHELISVSSSHIRIHREISPVPSIMLIIMTIILFADYDKIITILHTKRKSP